MEKLYGSLELFRRTVICCFKSLLNIPQKQVLILEKWMKQKNNYNSQQGQSLYIHNDIVYDFLEEKGNFSFWIYNVIISLMIDCEYKGYPYMLHITASHEGYNLWDAFFEKRGISENEVPQGARIVKVDLASASDFNIEALDTQNKRQRKLLYEISKEYGRLNAKTQNYIDEEYKELIAGRKVLGVLYRGTDYVKLHPPGHPVQPSLEQLAEVCRMRIKKHRYKYIYITTDERRAVNYFIAEFPECKILVNKRTYFDEFYDKPTTKDIAACRHNRDNDKYLTALEYLSSVHLLAQCDELVAGNCGGSRAALVLNGGRYKYVKIFDLGWY